MMIEYTGVFADVSQSPRAKRVVGVKETLKAIERDRAVTVVVARDAEPQVVAGVLGLAREKGLELVYADSMEFLGKACGIKVGAAVAALLAPATPL